MSSEPYESRLDETLREAKLPPADHAKVDAMADQMVAVTDQVAPWDSPGLYDIEGARRKCLGVLKAHRFTGTENVRHHAASWDLIGGDVVDLPAFDPHDPTQASVPRIIFAASPGSVRICRGTVYDSLTGVLLSIAQKPSWRCDWSGAHDIKPTKILDETIWSKPYLVTKAMGEYLLVFVVCSQCLDELITRGAEDFSYAANDRDRELIDGRWRPIFSNPRGNVWDSNDYPENHLPAAYLVNGIRYVIPHRNSGWREDDPKTYDNLPH